MTRESVVRFSSANNVTAVLAVKPWRLAKARLTVGPDARYALARAFTLDVLDVLDRTAQIARVLVVTSDGEVRTAARSRGAAVIEDRPLHSTDSHMDAVRLGAHWAMRNHPENAVLALVADLPSLTPQILSETVRSLSRQQVGVVRSVSEPLSSTMIYSADPRALTALQSIHNFPPASEPRHHVHVCARNDVNNTDDLSFAISMGVGAHTRAVTDQLLRPQLHDPELRAR